MGQHGLRICSRGLEAHPFVFPSTTRSGTFSVMKSSNEGPDSSVLEKPVREVEGELDEEGVARFRMLEVTIACACFRTECFRRKVLMIQDVCKPAEMSRDLLLPMFPQSKKATQKLDGTSQSNCVLFSA